MQKYLTKKTLVITVLGFFFGALVFFVSRSGVVSMENQEMDDYSIVIRSSDGQVVRSSEKNSGNTKRILPSGKYTVSLYNNSSSFFASVKVGRFLSSTPIEVAPVDLSGATYKASDPAGCAAYDSAYIYSWSCQSRLSSVSYHSKATSSSPSIKRPLLLDFFENSFMTDDIVASVFNYQGGLFMLSLLEPLGEEVSQVNEYAFYQFGSTGQLRDQTEGDFLDFIDKERTYKARSVNEDIVVFDDRGNEVYFLSSPTDNDPRFIGIEPILDDNGLELPLYGLRQSEHGVVLLYGNADRLDTDNRLLHDSRFIDGELPQEEPFRGYSTVAIASKDAGLQNIHNLEYTPRQAILCSEKTLCTLENYNLRIYQINGDQLIFKHSIPNVIQLLKTGEGSLDLVSLDGLLSLDIETLTGSYDFVFKEEHEFCGAENSDDNTLVCIRDKLTDVSSIVVLQDNESYDGIDRYVSKIGALGGVSTVTAFEDRIYLSIDISRFDNTVDPNERIQEITTFAEDIKNRVVELNIPEKYKVVIPFVE
ncbi:MAG: hypothetical protein LC687_01895 [Actinobacteria bacterium]|nr:hypothetical protein [Actinomycetota bacterium]